MIESSYWRAELRTDLVWLRQHKTFRRWSEKQHVLFERRIMLVAFQVRSLLERPKINDRARTANMPVLRYRKVDSRPFTATGPGWPHERFDMENPVTDALSVLDVCNQLIHYYWMQTYTEGQAFESMLVFSDYKRHKCAYHLRIDDLLSLFRIFGDNSSAVVGAESTWDEKRQDYVQVRAWGRCDT